MFKGKFIKVSLLVSVIAISIIITIVPGISDKMRPELDVPYEPTHPSVVSSMLSVANVGKGDVLYDLGCGDGRIVVMATRKFGAARAVGIDLDPQRLLEAQEPRKPMVFLTRFALYREISWKWTRVLQPLLPCICLTV